MKAKYEMEEEEFFQADMQSPLPEWPQWEWLNHRFEEETVFEEEGIYAFISVTITCAMHSAETKASPEGRQ